MSHLHYWMEKAGADYECKNCQVVLKVKISEVGNGYSQFLEYRYPNGDTSMVFDKALPDRCPTEEWDLGKWLPGATEI